MAVESELSTEAKVKLLTETFLGVGSRLELASYLEPEKPLWKRADGTIGGKPIEWIRRTLYFDVILGVWRATWSKIPGDPCLEQLVRSQECDDARSLFEEHLSRDRWVFKQFDIFRNRHAAHLSPVPNTLRKHVRSGGDENDFEHFLTFEAHSGFRKALTVFAKARLELGFGHFDFEECFEIARAQSEAFVAAIGVPSDEVFELALERMRKPTPLDDILGGIDKP